MKAINIINRFSRTSAYVVLCPSAISQELDRWQGLAPSRTPEQELDLCQGFGDLTHKLQEWSQLWQGTETLLQSTHEPSFCTSNNSSYLLEKNFKWILLIHKAESSSFHDGAGRSGLGASADLSRHLPALWSRFKFKHFQTLPLPRLWDLSPLCC